ncbi:hypothetical protein ABZP36_025000 [Zizania latifolia]
MYYCNRGFFPLGFPGGPVFAGPTSSSLTQQAPTALGFYPMGPYLSLPGQGGIFEGNTTVGAGGGTLTAAAPAAPLPVKPTHAKVGEGSEDDPKSARTSLW